MEATTLLAFAVLVIALDQSVKVSIMSWLRHGRTASFGCVTIRMVLNQRVHARSVRGTRLMVTWWLAELLAFVALVQLGPVAPGVVVPVALGAALGGAGSNLLDCLWRGGVIDFVDLGCWPVFNLADVVIIAGVVTAVLSG